MVSAEGASLPVMFKSPKPTASPACSAASPISSANPANKGAAIKTPFNTLPNLVSLKNLLNFPITPDPPFSNLSPTLS